MRNYHLCKIDLVSRCHFGGGAGSPPPMPKFEMPPMPKMPQPPAAAPMPERMDQSAGEAAMQARQAAARRDGVRQSILAGETGGYSNPVTGNSLLG
jgi:hypothetical protein